MRKKRAKNLSDNDVKTIEKLIESWEGPLRWKELLPAIDKLIDATYTRQALNKKPTIAKAFKDRRQSPRPRTPTNYETLSPELRTALQAVDRRDDKIRILTRSDCEKDAIIDNLTEKFIRWAYNAHLRGLSEDFLDRPLPEVDRDQTRLKDSRRSALDDD